MPITLGTNIASLKGQRQLARSSSQLSTVFERLSSGQRINRASDDAAGLAIADTLSADARVYAQGVRNLNDGVSLLNIADAAIENLSGIVVRLQELAEQSANGVYGDVQRQALDQEAQALSEEYFRIIQTTEFNGQKLLTGETPVITMQAGRGDNATLDASVGGAIGTGEFGTATAIGSAINQFNLESADFNGDGILDFVVTGVNTIDLYLGEGDGAFDSGTTLGISTGIVSDVLTGDFNNDGNIDILTGNGTSISLSYGNGDGTFQDEILTTTAYDVDSLSVGDINGDGLDDIVYGGSIRVSAVLANGDGTFSSEVTSILTGGTPRVELADFNNDGNLDIVRSGFTLGVEFGDGQGGFGSTVSLNGFSGGSGIAVEDVNGDGLIDIINLDNNLDVYFNTDGSNFTLSTTTNTLGSAPEQLDIGDLNGDNIQDIVVTDLTDDTIQIFIGNGDGTYVDGETYSTGNAPRGVELGDYNQDGVLDIITAAVGGISLHTAETTSGVAPLLEFSLATTAGARQALPQFQQKLDQLAQQRGEIGANLSRIDVATGVLTVSAENFRAAESRIRDADIASETANLVRLNILQQAAASVLSQANQQPQLALQLLRGGP